MGKTASSIPSLDICSLSQYREEDIVISRLSAYLEEHQSLVFPHRHSFYHLVFFTDGGGSHTIDFETFAVQCFQIYFMTPGQVHSWDFEGEMDGYVVNFSNSFFQSFLLRPDYLDTFSFWQGSTDKSVINLSREPALSILNLFQVLILQAVQPDGVLKNDMVRTLLLQIFIQVEQTSYRKHDSGKEYVGNSVVKSFQKLIDENFKMLRLPGEYAAMLNVTTNHLNALAKEHLGKQAGEVVRDRIILEAKRLLVSVDLTVSEIAYQLNFNDNSYFTKFFRKVVGVTPEEFRRKSVHEKK